MYFICIYLYLYSDIKVKVQGQFLLLFGYELLFITRYNGKDFVISKQLTDTEQNDDKYLDTDLT